MDVNAKKSKQLGMAFGTANARLRKQILFKLVQIADLNKCFRCGKQIETVSDFSIEHKQPWLDVSAELFWAWDNIAFSHFSCNVAHARKPGKKYFTETERLNADRKIDAALKRKKYTPEKRRQKYLAKGY